MTSSAWKRQLARLISYLSYGARSASMNTSAHKLILIQMGAVALLLLNQACPQNKEGNSSSSQSIESTVLLTDIWKNSVKSWNENAPTMAEISRSWFASILKRKINKCRKRKVTRRMASALLNSKIYSISIWQTEIRNINSLSLICSWLRALARQIFGQSSLWPNSLLQFINAVLQWIYWSECRAS